MILVECLAIAARCAAHIRDPAQGDDLLGLIPDLLGDQPGLLVVDQGLVVAFRLAVDGAGVIEHKCLVGQVADLAENGQGPAVGGERLLVAALVVVDAADVEIHNLGEYLQRALIGRERVPVIPG